jgi:hypothetical protein
LISENAEFASSSTGNTENVTLGQGNLAVTVSKFAGTILYIYFELWVTGISFCDISFNTFYSGYYYSVPGIFLGTRTIPHPF